MTHEINQWQFIIKSPTSELWIKTGLCLSLPEKKAWDQKAIDWFEKGIQEGEGVLLKWDQQFPNTESPSTSKEIKRVIEEFSKIYKNNEK